MAHPEQIEFFKSVKNKHPDWFKDRMILDIGSLDINGNNHYLFENCLYLGLDVAEGKNVDIVCSGGDLALPDQTFDTIISSECFEHDQFYEKTLKNIYRMLKDGGVFVFTCATTGRPEHGTRRTTPNDAPLLQNFDGWSDYYKNLTEQDIRNVFNIDTLFSIFEFGVNDKTKDLYFYGKKVGDFKQRNDYSFQINKDKSLVNNILNETVDNLKIANIDENGKFQTINNYYDKIKAHDVLHTVQSLFDLMSQCLNSLKIDGVLEIIVPYDLSLGAWSNPNTLRSFNEKSWEYFSSYFWKPYGIDAKFAIEKIEFTLTPYGVSMKNNLKTTDEILRTPRAVDKMNVVMKKYS